MTVSDLPEIEASAVPADAFVVDVREGGEWIFGHIGGALHIPLGELVTRVAEVPADRKVVVVCRVGARSAQAVNWLNNTQGRTTVNLVGGMAAWVRAGRSMVSETSQPPVVV